MFKEKKTEEIKVKEGSQKKSQMVAWKILKAPHISEKATELEKKNRYVFKVFSDSNKIQIKEAVEELYGVDVVSVNTINTPRKKKRLGKQKGWKPGFKKAIVEIKENQRIDMIIS